MGKLTDRLFGTPEERARKRETESRAKALRQSSYERGFIEGSRKEGYRAGREAARQKGKGGSGFLGTVGRYADSFSKAGEEMFGLPGMKPKKRQHKRKPRRRNKGK